MDTPQLMGSANAKAEKFGKSRLGGAELLLEPSGPKRRCFGNSCAAPDLKRV
jgi:hypothetical protein